MSQGECEHRLPKKLFQGTNKKNYEKQIASHVQNKEQISQVNDRVLRYSNPTPAKTAREPLPSSNPEAPYHISEGTRFWKDIPTWLQENKNDPAVQVFCLRRVRWHTAKLFRISSPNSSAISFED